MFGMMRLPASGSSPRPALTRRLLATAATASATVLLAGCAGSAGGPSTNGAGAGSGFDYGAAQADVDAALADLDPVTITYQPTAASEKSVMAPGGTVLAEEIEKRSGGKISVDIVWGQAIAGYTEVHDALADGRVDLAFTLPAYDPAEFPVFDAMSTSLALLPTSPYAGELVANAAGAEVAWGSDALVEEFEAQGLSPLIPLIASGGYYTICTDPLETAEDFDGRQIRIGSSAQSEQIQNLGATPVSLPFPETYEALQRNTIDCDLGQLIPAAESGMFDVAEHIAYPTEHSFSRSPGAYMAGKTYRELPLAYQQVIYDAMIAAFDGQMQVSVGGNAVAVGAVKHAGGTINEFPAEVQDALGEQTQTMSREAGEKAGQDSLADDMTAAGEKWGTRIEELGFTDGGGVEDLDEWYDDETDYRKFGTAVFEDVFQDHRPE